MGKLSGLIESYRTNRLYLRKERASKFGLVSLIGFLSFLSTTSLQTLGQRSHCPSIPVFLSLRSATSDRLILCPTPRFWATHDSPCLLVLRFSHFSGTLSLTARKSKEAISSTQNPQPDIDLAANYHASSNPKVLLEVQILLSYLTALSALRLPQISTTEVTTSQFTNHGLCLKVLSWTNNFR